MQEVEWNLCSDVAGTSGWDLDVAGLKKWECNRTERIRCNCRLFDLVKKSSARSFATSATRPTQERCTSKRL